MNTSRTQTRSERAVTNTLIQLLPQGMRLPLSIVLTAILARYLGVKGFGEYATVFAFVGLYVGVFNDVGLSSIVVREIARHPGDRPRILSSAAGLQVVVATVTYSLLLGGILIAHYPAAVSLSVAIFGLSVFLSPIDLLSLPFTADLRLSKLVSPGLAGTVLNFLLILGAIAVHAELPALVAVALVAIALQYVMVGYLSVRHLGRLPFPEVRLWLPLLRESMPLAFNSVVVSFTVQAPILYLSHTSLSEAGVFNAANRLPQQLLLVPFAVRATTFPLLARSWDSDRSTFLRQLNRTFGISLMLGIPLAVGGVALAPVAVPLLFGEKFVSAVVPLQLLLAQFAIVFPYIVIAEALIATGHQKTVLALSITSVPVILAGLVVGANYAGAIGTSLAFLTYYVWILSITLLVAYARLGGASSIRDLVAALPVLLCGILFAKLIADYVPIRGATIIAAFSVAGVSAAAVAVLQRDTARELFRRLRWARFMENRT